MRVFYFAPIVMSSLMGFASNFFLTSLVAQQQIPCNNPNSGACEKSCVWIGCAICGPCAGGAECVDCLTTNQNPPPNVCSTWDCSTPGPGYCTNGGDSKVNRHCANFAFRCGTMPSLCPCGTCE